MDEDEIHGLHGFEGDGGVGAGALRGGGDVVAFGGVGVHGGAEGGDEGVVEGCAVVFVVYRDGIVRGHVVVYVNS